MMKMNGDMKPMNMKMGLQKMDANSVMYPEVPEEDRKATMQHLKGDDESLRRRLSLKRRSFRPRHAIKAFRFQSR